MLKRKKRVISLLFSLACIISLHSAPAISGDSSFATNTFTSGPATFGQVIPQGFVKDAVSVGDLLTQTDVKVRWPDGTVRYAIVSTIIPESDAGPLGIFPSTKTTNQNFEESKNYIGDNHYLYIVLGMGEGEGTYDWGAYTYITDQDIIVSEDVYLDGPIVRERRIKKPFYNYVLDETGEQHQFLEAIFDVRTLVDGSFSVDVIINNIKHSRGTTVSYTPSIGTCESFKDHDFCAELYTKDRITHHYLTNWHMKFDVSGPERSVVSIDPEPIYQTKAINRLQRVHPMADTPFGEEFWPLGRGTLFPEMPRSGGRPEISAYPDWTSSCLVTHHPRACQVMFGNADFAAGAFPVHVVDDNGNLINLDDQRWRNYWLDFPLNRPAEQGWQGVEGPRGWLNGPFIPDNAHQPSLAYVPYLMTGSRYYLDEMAYWANYVLLSQFHPGRNERVGEPINQNTSPKFLWYDETRGFFHGLRNLTDTAAYLPDNHPMKSYFVETVTNNLIWLDYHVEHYVDQYHHNMVWEPGLLGVAWHWPGTFIGNNPWGDPELIYQSADQNNHLMWSVWHANGQGFSGGTSWMLQLAQFNISLMNDTHMRDRAGPYYTPIGRRGNPTDWFDNIRQTDVGPTQYEGFYGPGIRNACIIGLEHNIPGAQECYDYIHPIIGQRPYDAGDGLLIPDIYRRAGYAFAGPYE